MVLGTGFNIGGYCREIELASREGRSLAVNGGVQEQGAHSADGFIPSTEKEMGPSPPIGKALAAVAAGAVTCTAGGAYAGYKLTGNPWVAVGSGVAGLAVGVVLGAKGFDAYFN